ncbi:mediator of RNA polymerase II transcription subunit 7-like [Hydractinia symbiolongicarpus]|uniref:mediator of RNA polymerase II transcription subunit 7-like n=1 Tax=Hydractinia symbiolongicarpus TaxID=13093 RepID=UPI00254AF9A0|nr:mediator of RNA polymerase II transcription subunit 7-like [Hydractinia symbiolongicarpus]
MAGAGNTGEDAQLSFPLPPTFYYKHYTNHNVKAKLVPKAPAPVTGEYTMFGHQYKTDDEIIQPLESQGIKRLYSKEKQFDHIVEMKKLNHSILVNYLELLETMIEEPASAERIRKIEEIKVLFINLHHLINEFRPHQARETLRIMLHRQKQQRLETTERLRLNIDKAKSILKACAGQLNNLQGSTSIAVEDTKVPGNNTNETVKELEALRHKIMCDIVDEIS